MQRGIGMGMRESLAIRYWEASLVWKGMRDHPRISNYEQLIDELSDLAPQLWSVGYLAQMTLTDVVEDVQRRPRATLGQLYRFTDGKPVVVYTNASIDEPKTMVS